MKRGLIGFFVARRVEPRREFQHHFLKILLAFSLPLQTTTQHADVYELRVSLHYFIPVLPFNIMMTYIHPN